MEDDVEAMGVGPRLDGRRLRVVGGDTTTVPGPARRVAALDGSGFDAFFTEQAPGILALLLTLTGDRGQAEDLTQEAFVKAYRDWGRISGYDKPGAWVRRVAINAATSAGRRRSTEGRALRRVWSRTRDDVAPDAADLADDSAEFWALVRSLPKQQAAAIALHYLDDAPVADIAGALGCAEATAKVHLHRGRAALARLLDVDDGAEVDP